jgi:hypothetical protein
MAVPLTRQWQRLGFSTHGKELAMTFLTTDNRAHRFDTISDAERDCAMAGSLWQSRLLSDIRACRSLFSGIGRGVQSLSSGC